MMERDTVHKGSGGDMIHNRRSANCAVSHPSLRMTLFNNEMSGMREEEKEDGNRLRHVVESCHLLVLAVWYGSLGSCHYGKRKSKDVSKISDLSSCDHCLRPQPLLLFCPVETVVDGCKGIGVR